MRVDNGATYDFLFSASPPLFLYAMLVRIFEKCTSNYIAMDVEIYLKGRGEL